MATSGSKHQSSDLSDAFAKAAERGERVTLEHGGVRAAVVPEEDLLLLEAIENFLDVRDLKRRRRTARSRGETPVPYERARKLLRF